MNYFQQAFVESSWVGGLRNYGEGRSALTFQCLPFIYVSHKFQESATCRFLSSHRPSTGPDIEVIVYYHFYEKE